MRPYLDDPDLTLYVGDALAVLRELPAESVDCCMTSPPYFGLRDYGAEGQIGLEATPDEYVARLVEVFAEVRRVLRPTGTCWVNLGDSYVGSANRGPSASISDGSNGRSHPAHGQGLTVQSAKPKDLLGIPWRVALALQADGWWLRSDVIWSKPNPMPESVTDRPTRSHEYLFMLAKAPRYFFDAEAVREKRDPEQIAWRERYENTISKWAERREDGVADSPRRGGNGGLALQENRPTRNIRSVWTIPTQPYPEAHFATFPERLVEQVIAAGCPERVCAQCGVPSERVVEVKRWRTRDVEGHVTSSEWERTGRAPRGPSDLIPRKGNFATVPTTTGWTDCGHSAYRPGVILDPFMGSGTVAAVARRMGRRAVGIELNPEYVELVAKRTRQLSLLGGVG